MPRATLLLAILGLIPMNPGVAAQVKVCLMAGQPDLPAFSFCAGDSPHIDSEAARARKDNTGPAGGRANDRQSDETPNGSATPSAEVSAAQLAKAGDVRKIDNDHYTVGGVALRQSTREISFDAQINQSGGLIEYLLVTEKGKVHESLFSCAIRPTDLNIAFKLLGYPSSPELFEMVGADQRPTGKYPDVAEEIKNGARLEISATWRQDGKEKTCKVNELVKNTASEAVMPPGPWLYTGSLIHQGVFRAEATGDIIAVFSNPTAMINYPGDSRTNDEVWTVKPNSVPAKGTPLRITIRPFPKPAAASANPKSP